MPLTNVWLFPLCDESIARFDFDGSNQTDNLVSEASTLKQADTQHSRRMKIDIENVYLLATSIRCLNILPGTCITLNLFHFSMHLSIVRYKYVSNGRG